MTVSPSAPDIVQPKTGCNCIELTNEALKEHNTRLGESWQFNQETGQVGVRIAIRTEILEKKRGARPINLLATYCPLCATPYEAAAQASESAEGQD